MRGEIQLNVAVNTGIGDGHPQEMPERSITMTCQRLSMEHATNRTCRRRLQRFPTKAGKVLGAIPGPHRRLELTITVPTSGNNS